MEVLIRLNSQSTVTEQCILRTGELIPLDKRGSSGRVTVTSYRLGAFTERNRVALWVTCCRTPKETPLNVLVADVEWGSCSPRRADPERAWQCSQSGLTGMDKDFNKKRDSYRSFIRWSRPTKRGSERRGS